MSKNYFEKYAEALARVGINVQADDNIVINCDLDSLPLVRKVAEICWQEGANDVLVRIDDRELNYIAYENASLESLGSIADFKVDYNIALMENNYHRMAIRTASPGFFDAIDGTRMRANQTANAKASEPLQKYMDQGNIKWVVASTASPYWARQLFPDLDEDEGMEKLWELIYKACRIDQADPISNWESHDAHLKDYENWLNEKNFDYLHYQGPGTDLKVYLAENHKWVGGSSTTPDGIKYMANMPTEEIFTSPHMYKVEGYVSSTKPLSVMGKIIDEFKLVFKNGEVVDFEASNNGDILQILLDTDANAKRLGEAALVPHSSPISKTGTLFKSTLFDENASCHFALGQSYAETLIDGEIMTNEEKESLGANRSLIHTDFMIGSNQLNVTGVNQLGQQIPILRKGEWAFEL